MEYILKKVLLVFSRLGSLEVADVVKFYDSVQKILMQYLLPLMPFDLICLVFGFEGLCPPGLGTIRYTAIASAWMDVLPRLLLQEDSDIESLKFTVGYESNNSYDLMWRVLELAVPGFKSTNPVKVPSCSAASDILSFCREHLLYFCLQSKHNMFFSSCTQTNIFCTTSCSPNTLMWLQLSNPTSMPTAVMTMRVTFQQTCALTALLLLSIRMPLLGCAMSPMVLLVCTIHLAIPAMAHGTLLSGPRMATSHCVWCRGTPSRTIVWNRVAIVTVPPRLVALMIGRVPLAVAAVAMAAHLLAIGKVAATVDVTMAVLPLGIAQSALITNVVAFYQVYNAMRASGLGMLPQTVICWPWQSFSTSMSSSPSQIRTNVKLNQPGSEGGRMNWANPSNYPGRL